MKYLYGKFMAYYLQTIMKREEEELTKRVFNAQVEMPCEGDFA